MMKADIFNIQRFSIHDGPGIRTTIFLKGCPMRCLWCANPESQHRQPELSVMQQHCIGCGACVQVCREGAVSFEKGQICIDRQRCTACGACAGECYSNTLKLMGKKMTVEEVFAEIQKDAAFYANSGGGYTLSGGEPLLQGEFCCMLAEKCKADGIHGAIETAGYGGEPDKLYALAGMLDLIFFDVKHMDDAVHRQVTGVSNVPVLDNLRAIQGSAKEIILRTPLIAGCNDTRWNIEQTARLCNASEKVKKWEILPYHKLGEHKYRQLDRPYEMSHAEKTETKRLEELIDIANHIMSRSEKQCVLNDSF